MDLQLIKSLTVIDAEVRQRAEEAKHIASQAEGFEVANADGVQLAKNNIVTIRAMAKEIDSIRISITGPIDELKKRIKAAYDAPIAVLNNALSTYSMKMQVWLKKQADIADREARKLQVKADESARKEREKLEAKAKTLDEKGKTEQADSLREQKETIVPEVPIVNSAPVLPKGTYERVTWSAQVIDIDKLPREYMLPNYEGLNKIAQATKGTLKIAGVVFKAEKKLISRS